MADVEDRNFCTSRSFENSSSLPQGNSLRWQGELHSYYNCITTTTVYAPKRYENSKAIWDNECAFWYRLRVACQWFQETGLLQHDRPHTEAASQDRSKDRSYSMNNTRTCRLDVVYKESCFVKEVCGQSCIYTFAIIHARYSSVDGYQRTYRQGQINACMGPVQRWHAGQNFTGLRQIPRTGAHYS